MKNRTLTVHGRTYVTAPEYAHDACKGCEAETNRKVCGALINKLVDVTGETCYSTNVIFKKVPDRKATRLVVTPIAWQATNTLSGDTEILLVTVKLPDGIVTTTVATNVNGTWILHGVPWGTHVLATAGMPEPWHETAPQKPILKKESK